MPKSPDEVRDFLGLLRDAAISVATYGPLFEAEVRTFASRLEPLLTCEDLGDLREQFASELIALHSSIEATRREQARGLALEMRSIEQRLREAERLASTDPLTGLYNRREGQIKAEQRKEKGKPYCLLVIDLDRFKQVNDRYGHLCGDQVLKGFARRLEEQVRPSDTVCRLGGDEFLIVMDCGLADAKRRVAHMNRNLRGVYPAIVHGQRVEVELSATIGVAEGLAAETVEQTFERADAMLLAIKPQAMRG